uniref:Uncharacterized protein n=1 Tax=Ixodes ricinus TaxID=34613 RepID=A0A6B0TZN6_IXORI
MSGRAPTRWWEPGMKLRKLTSSLLLLDPLACRDTSGGFWFREREPDGLSASGCWGRRPSLAMLLAVPPGLVRTRIRSGKVAHGEGAG